MSTNPFSELLTVNVDQYVEKKGKLDYLSWSHALAEIFKRDPEANWEFHEPTTFPDGTMMLWCSFTAFGKTIKMHLPVMDNRNQAIQNPSATDINKNMQRCLVKAIAGHGLGLYLYSKDGMPEISDVERKEVKSLFITELTEAAKLGFDALQKKHTELSQKNKALLNEIWAEKGEGLKNASLGD